MLALPAVGSARVANVNAAGNPFTGGLAFKPPGVAVRVGDSVRWRNTDFLVPHTATEDHHLWDLGGNYPPLTMQGFGPGETVKRKFAAGTFSYFCEVHGAEAMSGFVEVPVRLRDRRRGGRFKVVARWSEQGLPKGQVFDVQRSRGTGGLKFVRRGTRALKGTFGGGDRGTVWTFRARVRRAGNPAAASGWSPPKRIRVG
jgi:plastocyanin